MRVPNYPAVDDEGTLYVTDSGTWKADEGLIYRIAPGGEAEVLVEDPEGTLIAAPTNVAFGGEDLDLLLVASLGRWHLAVGEIGMSGAPLRYPHVA